MCHRNSPPAPKPPSMINKKTLVSLKPARKTRTRTRKPKFLSLLCLDISSDTSQQSNNMTHHHHQKHQHQQQQLNLFPLHPEKFVEEKDMQEENIAHFFSTDDDATLTGLLEEKTQNDAVEGTSTMSTSEQDSFSPASLTYAYGGQDSEEGCSLLVRAALKCGRERDASEEKWVCYSEVVEERKEEEVTSCGGVWCKVESREGLSLKLDYQQILNAWSDKGPLFVEGECPQTVPDLPDEFSPHDGATVLTDGWGSIGSGGLWRVPEKGGNLSNVKIKEEVGEEGWKLGQREASVQRYKEKRQSRLFSKRIRYEVRKLNAEKRPRIKGRFVKRS